jgi:uncharacterized Zn finger protein (UPF0148 family)
LPAQQRALATADRRIILKEITETACAGGNFPYFSRDYWRRDMELTCPNCNVDIDREELKRSNLCCPTCGFDLSETEDPDDKDEWDEESEDIAVEAEDDKDDIEDDKDDLAIEDVEELDDVEAETEEDEEAEDEEEESATDEKAETGVEEEEE